MLTSAFRRFCTHQGSRGVRRGHRKEVLADLEASYWDQARILGDDGAIRRFVNIYVGDEDVGSPAVWTRPPRTGSRCRLSRRWRGVLTGTRVVQVWSGCDTPRPHLFLGGKVPEGWLIRSELG